MGEGSILMPMAILSRESGETIKKRDMECIVIRKERNMRGYGKMV